MKYHCFFEQSGTFKNEFKKLGYEAYDYDKENKFSETDYVIDLFEEIELAYYGFDTIFNNFKKEEDTIIAFFPCTRFENQIMLCFRGENYNYRKWSLKEKLEKDIQLHKELNKNYEIITKLCIVAIEKNIPLIIENPYSEQHYLRRYWCIKPKIIDKNRREEGDDFIKPTQYWFINCEPKYNLILEPLEIRKQKKIVKEQGIKRSIISKQYARRFIKENIIEEIKIK